LKNVTCQLTNKFIHLRKKFKNINKTISLLLCLGPKSDVQQDHMLSSEISAWGTA